MFEIFNENYMRDSVKVRGGRMRVSIPDIAGLSDFFCEYGGSSFNEGLYRIIRADNLHVWQDRVDLAFPEFRDRVVCFGFDWAGRIFALDAGRLEDGQAGVLLLEPGTGEALRIPSHLQTFHDSELVEFGEAALGVSFYEKWRTLGGVAPAYNQCIGYRRPLFLGGIDGVENLEVSDIDIYWHIMGQLILKVKDFPPGAAVNINIS